MTWPRFVKWCCWDVWWLYCAGYRVYHMRRVWREWRHPAGIPQRFWDWYEWNLARRNEEWVVVRRIWRQAMISPRSKA